MLLCHDARRCKLLFLEHNFASEFPGVPSHYDDPHAAAGPGLDACRSLLFAFCGNLCQEALRTLVVNSYNAEWHREAFSFGPENAESMAWP